MRYVSPVITHEITLWSFVPLILSIAFAYGFFRFFVPRSLAGLQVAFPTGPMRYEVHTITKDKNDAKELLRSPSMRFGVIAYTMALTGAIIIVIEFLLLQLKIISAYDSISLIIALALITLPAIISAGTSLTAQVIRPQGQLKATLQDSSTGRIAMGIGLTIAWFALTGMVAYLLGVADISLNHRIPLIAFFAFLPSVIAYGRILGSNWGTLRSSSKMLGNGEPSPFHPDKPNAREQIVAQLVFYNAAVMPYVAINTLVSLVLILIDPSLFTHSQQVELLPEYRQQATIMEEGGIIGFYAIELFSFIGEAGIRVPLVTGVLLFLLFNVAIVGFLFVYEVARILFLNISEVSGYGNIKLADSRLIRSEKSQQAKVLNFCFTGFAGLSMLLLALAMLTFWDSTFLPKGGACGSWENSVCVLMQKDALEELTWMLASGGQISFLYIWARSRKFNQSLENIQIDAKVGEERAKMAVYEKAIFRKQESFSKMVSRDSWHRALIKLQALYEDPGEASVEGLTLSRRAEASMDLFAGLGRWEEAEQVAISVLALRSGKKEEIARKILLAASLSQRDSREATPRINLLKVEGVEEARLQWMASVISPGRKLPLEVLGILKVDPLTKRNIELIERWESGDPIGKLSWRDDGPGRLIILGDIARMRIYGESEKALYKLMAWMNTSGIERWTHGHIARALCHYDLGEEKIARDIVRECAEHSSRHPHLRWLIRHFGMEEELELLEIETTGLCWFDETSKEWRTMWHNTHTNKPAPENTSPLLQRHTWDANAWIIRAEIDEPKTSKKYWKKHDWQTEVPLGTHLLLSGLVTTIGNMPVDIGFPGWIDVPACRKAGLLD
ncbi:MAG: hypothetical protein ACKVJ7_00465 [Candidatus Poseidoniales archaeon]